jgi:hypothetical protein
VLLKHGFTLSRKAVAAFMLAAIEQKKHLKRPDGSRDCIEFL